MTELTPKDIRQVDKLFEYYADKSNRVIKELCYRPEDLPQTLWTTYLDSDPCCGFDMGANPKSKSVCLNCKSLNRLKEDFSSKEILVEYGKMVGTTLVIKKFSNVTDLSLSLKGRARNNLSLYPELSTCGTPKDRLPRIALDPVTSEILMTWSYENVIEDSPKLITAFRCGRNVYTVSDKTNTIDHCKDHTVILYQLVTILNKLSKYYFTHGDPSPEHIKFTNDGDNRLLLTMGGHSNMSIGNTRICSNEYKVNIGSTDTYYKVWNTGSLTMFCVPRESFTSFSRDRRSGSILYPGSLDFYCFLVGMMANQTYQDYIQDYLSDIWHIMWLGEGDIVKLNNRIDKWRLDYPNLYPTYTDIMLNILDGIWMRCDILSIVTYHIE